MTVLEPGQEPDYEVMPEEEALAAIATLPPPPAVVEAAFRDVCAHCLRGVVLDDTRGYLHWDPRIDIPDNPAYHLAELYVEEQTKWGFLNVDGKDQFKVGESTKRGGGGGRRHR